MHSSSKRWASLACAAVALTAAAAPQVAAQFPPDSFTNLRVLSKDIRPDSLVRMMASFTRALGVRCTHCHVGEETIPLAEYDFASDEKLPKRKARVMLEMLGRINGDHLASLEQRVDPPVRVECITCHRGTREPRMLQDILLFAYDAGGADSAIATYHALRRRSYGRFTYDFSEVPLADVGGTLASRRELADAERIHALNVEMNPSSAFAKRQHAGTALAIAFTSNEAAGRARHAELKAAYGPTIFQEQLLNQLGYQLLGMGQAAAAVAVFRVNVEEYPDAFNTHDSLGEGLAAAGDVAGAIRAYEKSLELNPQNTNAVEKLRELRRRR